MKVRYRMIKPHKIDESCKLDIKIDSNIFSRPTITTIKEMKRLATKVRTVDHHDLSYIHLYTASEFLNMVNCKLIPSVEEFDPETIFNEIKENELTEVETTIETLDEREFMETKLSIMLDITIDEYRRLKRSHSFLLIMCHGGYLFSENVKTEFPKECFVVSIGDMAGAVAKHFKQAETMANQLGVELDEDFTLGVPIAKMRIENNHYCNLPVNSFVFNAAIPSI